VVKEELNGDVFLICEEDRTMPILLLSFLLLVAFFSIAIFLTICRGKRREIDLPPLLGANSQDISPPFSLTRQ
jgi:ABC-type lipoprotein release transport system permease subunit